MRMEVRDVQLKFTQLPTVRRAVATACRVDPPGWEEWRVPGTLGKILGKDVQPVGTGLQPIGKDGKVLDHLLLLPRVFFQVRGKVAIAVSRPCKVVELFGKVLEWLPKRVERVGKPHWRPSNRVWGLCKPRLHRFQPVGGTDKVLGEADEALGQGFLLVFPNLPPLNH